MDLDYFIGDDQSNLSSFQKRSWSHGVLSWTKTLTIIFCLKRTDHGGVNLTSKHFAAFLGSVNTQLQREQLHLVELYYALIYPFLIFFFNSVGWYPWYPWGLNPVFLLQKGAFRFILGIFLEYTCPTFKFLKIVNFSSLVHFILSFLCKISIYSFYPSFSSSYRNMHTYNTRLWNRKICSIIRIIPLT